MSDWKFFLLIGFLFFLVDTYVYLKGHNTLFWAHKTPAELEYQRKALGLDHVVSGTEINLNVGEK